MVVVVVLCGDTPPFVERDTDDATPRRIRTNFGVMCMHVSPLIVVTIFHLLFVFVVKGGGEEKTPLLYQKENFCVN